MSLIYRFIKMDSSGIKKQQLNDHITTQPLVKPKNHLSNSGNVLHSLTLKESDASRLKRVKTKSSTQTITPLRIKKNASADSSSGGGGTVKISSVTPDFDTLTLKPASPSHHTAKLFTDGDHRKVGTLRIKTKPTVEVANRRSGVKRYSAREEETLEHQQPIEIGNTAAKASFFMALSSLVAITAAGVIKFKLIQGYVTVFAPYSQQ